MLNADLQASFCAWVASQNHSIIQPLKRLGSEPNISVHDQSGEPLLLHDTSCVAQALDDGKLCYCSPRWMHLIFHWGDVDQKP
jgi:hypothetical protein